MVKQWFQLKEQGAGMKRLILTMYIYKWFGSLPLRIIAFFVVLSVFLTAKERREASGKFYKILNKKPVLLSSFRQFLNYGNALVDKFISSCGDLSLEKFKVEDNEIFDGTLFLMTHIGNIEVLRTLLSRPGAKRANVFMQSNACEIFNKFLKMTEAKVNLEIFPVEEINAETSITVSERLKNGEIVFIAGDRVSAQNTNKVYTRPFLGRKITLPLGSLKFALMLGAPICFIVCAKEGQKYVVHTEKFTPKSEKKSEILEELEIAYVDFLEKYTLKYPYQFYNFFDILE